MNTFRLKKQSSEAAHGESPSAQRTHREQLGRGDTEAESVSLPTSESSAIDFKGVDGRDHVCLND